MITLLSQLRNYNVVCDEQLHNINHPPPTLLILQFLLSNKTTKEV